MVGRVASSRIERCWRPANRLPSFHGDYARRPRVAVDDVSLDDGLEARLLFARTENVGQVAGVSDRLARSKRPLCRDAGDEQRLLVSCRVMKLRDDAVITLNLHVRYGEVFHPLLMSVVAAVDDLAVTTIGAPIKCEGHRAGDAHGPGV